MLGLARKPLQANQQSLFPEEQSSLRVVIKRSFSELLWSTLREEYGKIGFTRLDDEVFEALCLTRIVEPTSKLDSLRVMADLGMEPIN